MQPVEWDVGYIPLLLDWTVPIVPSSRYRALSSFWGLGSEALWMGRHSSTTI